MSQLWGLWSNILTTMGHRYILLESILFYFPTLPTAPIFYLTKNLPIANFADFGLVLLNSGLIYTYFGLFLVKYDNF